MRVKLCGVASMEALRIVGQARPDAVGFVLAESPRQVDLEQLERLVDAVPGRVERWAVFRRPDPAVVRQLAHLALTGVQGDAGWDGAGLSAGQAYLPVHADGPDLVQRLRDDGWNGRWREVRGLAGAFVVDGPKGGGRGIRVDVERAAVAARLGPMVLAGGLRPENVREAVEAVRPYAVDVSSGIESSPAVKDSERVVAFVRAARNAAETGRGGA